MTLIIDWHSDYFWLIGEVALGAIFKLFLFNQESKTQRQSIKNHMKKQDCHI